MLTCFYHFCKSLKNRAFRWLLLCCVISVPVVADWICDDYDFSPLIRSWVTREEDDCCDECDCDCECTFHNQALGPFCEGAINDEWGYGAFRPFSVTFAQYEGHPNVESHFLYPFASERHTPNCVTTSWLFHLINHTRRMNSDGSNYSYDWTLFPIYFSHTSCNPCLNYRGVFPVAGTVKGFLGLQEFSWMLFPLYARFDHGSYRRIGMPWPFIQWQEGCGSGGFALWPLFGHFYKEGCFDHRYFLWPLIYKNVDKMDTDCPITKKGFLPFYSTEYSENMKSETVVWPLFGYTLKEDPLYYEVRHFWPFIVTAQWENGDYTRRYLPFYSESLHKGVHKCWMMWPLFQHKCWKERGINIYESRVLRFLCWSQVQTSDVDPEFYAKKTHLWPFYSTWTDGYDKEQIQILSPFEPIFPENRVIRHLYSPLFALYRYNKYSQTHTEHQLLFNTISYESTPCWHCLRVGGLFKYANFGDETEVKILNGLIHFKKNCECGASLSFLDFPERIKPCRVRPKHSHLRL